MTFLNVIVILPILFVVQHSLSVEVARYDNYRVYEVTASTSGHLETLEFLKSSSDSVIFLESGSKVGDYFNIVVAPHKLADFAATLENEGMHARVLEMNLQEPIDAERNRMVSKRIKGIFDWTDYRDLTEIHDWLEKLALEYDQVEIINGGRSYENRTIKGVKVSYKSGNPGIFIEGGIHAREWISPATVTYILNQLLTSEEKSVRHIAENYDWYIFPSVNPDGYAYSHKTDRLWRKTRTPYPGGCFGADPNRNWDYYWAEKGSSHRCTAESFAGSHPFSEIETKTLSDYINSLRGKIQTYITFHSYSQLLLFPYGHTSQHAENHQDMNEIAKATVTSLAQRYGTKYRYGNIYDAIYPASGGSGEWAYGVQGIKLVFTYELRPAHGWVGFVLPPEQIIPTGEETLDSLVTLVDEAAKRGYYKVGVESFKTLEKKCTCPTD
ncbi:zinc carboxypeptidase A 1-like [Topomyia yanbarensis]|uniref:zinc carboxypeptidase A 1-like n=1 Tax=Topomyia yanbarensis TaxID=2498891 RepID=UPI00273B2AFF|nr:zinc carboxypeptidase A 1-like [Topomyia yanbarensis]